MRGKPILTRDMKSMADNAETLTETPPPVPPAIGIDVLARRAAGSIPAQ
jgi:hypothetical protein